ncbi:MAG: ParA family protein [Parcubacteria group bacterium]
MPRIIAVCNQKGGVGKTTTAVNLGACIAMTGRKVLLVDFDPQANASSAVGSTGLEDKNIYHGILGYAEPAETIKASQIPNYFYIPSGPHLSGAMVELVNVEGREFFLKNFLAKITGYYDYVIVDLPPSLSLLTINGLLASEEVIIPVQAEYYSLEGLSHLLETMEMIKQNMGHNLKVSGAVITMFDRWEQLSQEVAKNLRANFPYPVFETEIPRSVHLAEAPSFNQPVSLYAPDSAGAEAYREFAEEVLRQERTFGEGGSIVP